MQSVDDFRKNFDKLYYGKILTVLKPFEDERITCIKNCIGCIIIGCICLFIVWKIIGLSNVLGEDLSEWLGALMLFAGVVFFIIPSCLASSFENHIKDKVMPVLLKTFNDFKWSGYSSFIDENYIKKSKLVGDFNMRENDDCFNGEYKDVKIDICETYLAKESGSGKSKTIITKFKGVLVKLIPERKFKGITLIKKDHLIDFVPEGTQQVHLEDVEFEKKYNVYSNDQIEARYILTTAFMERFNNISLAFNASTIEASISQQGILIGISTGRDLFKVGKLHKPVCDYEQFNRMKEEFASILELIDELKLYQNIGM